MRRVNGPASTIRRTWVRKNINYVGCDYQSGLDVDVVADAEQLSNSFETGSIDAVIARSVFEHIRKPWLGSARDSKSSKAERNCFYSDASDLLHPHPSP